MFETRLEAIDGHTKLDLDHLIPWRRGGPPGRTRVDGLAPLARPEHRPKTHNDWQIRQPDPGTYLWRSPHGIISLVTDQGTLLLGRGPHATELWETAEPRTLAAA